MTITEMVIACHDYAKRQGFWNASQNVGEKLMLIVTELAEAMEAARKGPMTGPGINDTAEGYQRRRQNFEEELADATIRIFDFCGYFGVDLEKAIEKKMAHNETRPYMHGKIV